MSKVLGDVRSLGETKNGIATFYDGIGNKNCGLDDPDDRLFAAARKDSVYAAGAACGTCMRVTGELGSVVLSIIDSCPVGGNQDCGNSGATLDLSPEAFEKIAPKSKGKVNMTYEPVSCPTVGNVAFRFKEGSSQYWTAIQVRNHKLPITKVDYLKNGNWVNMGLVDYNYFIDTNGVGPQPNGLSLRITGSDGQQITESFPTIGDGNVVNGQKQFE